MKWWADWNYIFVLPATHGRHLGIMSPSASSSSGQNIFFLNIVMLHFKLKGMERRRAPCKHIFCPYTHPRSLGFGQKVKTFSFIMWSCCISK